MIIPGMIILWFGGFATIPAGWAFCDGQNGTPDLRGKFVRAVGGGFAFGATGGSEVHNHLFESDPHHHGFTPGTEFASYGTANVDDMDVITEGRTDDGSSAPSYHTLIYMMKL